jgi:hypothetical protein
VPGTGNDSIAALTKDSIWTDTQTSAYPASQRLKIDGASSDAFLLPSLFFCLAEKAINEVARAQDPLVGHERLPSPAEGLDRRPASGAPDEPTALEFWSAT